jgi:hypothetical protein
MSNFYVRHIQTNELLLVLSKEGIGCARGCSFRQHLGSLWRYKCQNQRGQIVYCSPSEVRR